MGGRIYDPRLARFLQTDPIVQAPFEPQNLNRYSYVMNRPLGYIDPTGYVVEGPLSASEVKKAQKDVITEVEGSTTCGSAAALEIAIMAANDALGLEDPSAPEKVARGAGTAGGEISADGEKAGRPPGAAAAAPDGKPPSDGASGAKTGTVIAALGALASGVVQAGARAMVDEAKRDIGRVLGAAAAAGLAGQALGRALESGSRSRCLARPRRWGRTSHSRLVGTGSPAGRSASEST